MSDQKLTPRAKKLIDHLEHHLEVGVYGPQDNPASVTVECVDCGAVLTEELGPVWSNPTDNEATVLIHLNITVKADGFDQAEQAASRYLRAHNIPVDDIALIDPQ